MFSFAIFLRFLRPQISHSFRRATDHISFAAKISFAIISISVEITILCHGTSQVVCSEFVLCFYVFASGFRN